MTARSPGGHIEMEPYFLFAAILAAILIWGRIPLIAAVFIGLFLPLGGMMVGWMIMFALGWLGVFLYHCGLIALAIAMAVENRRGGDAEELC